MVLLGDIVGEDDSVVAAATSEIVRLANARSGEGFILDIVLGVVGAVAGGAIFSSLGAAGVTGFNLYSMGVAIVGAVVVLIVYHAVFGRRAA